MEVSLLRPVEEESGPSPTPEEETTLLGKGDGPSGAPGPAPLQAKVPRFVEPAKWTTTPVTSTAPHHLPSLKRGKSWEVIDINPSNTSQWVKAYLKRDSWLPEWWEECWPLTHSVDGCCCNDAQAKNMACQQAVAFCVPATQKEVQDTWLTPHCLSELKKKEYLGLKDPQLTSNYQEVWKEETVVLAIILQQCTIWARAPPDMFSGVVQELHEHLALVVEEGDWLNMEKRSGRGLWKTPWLLLHQGLPCQKEYHCRCLEQRSPSAPLHQNLPLCLNQKGLYPSGPGSSTKEAATTPWVFFQRSQRTLPCHS